MKIFRHFQFNLSHVRIKDYTVSIIILSVSMSFITGANFFINSYHHQLFQENFTNLSDFQFHCQFITRDINNDFISEKNQELFEETLRNGKLPFERAYKYLIFNSGPTFTLNQFIIYFTPRYYIYEQEFYQSDRFSEYIHILNGTYPTSPESLLIHYEVAKHFNLTTGSKWSQHFQTSSTLPHVKYPSEYIINFTIAGIYLPLKSTIDYSSSNHELYVDQYYDVQTRAIIQNPIEEMDNFYGSREIYEGMFSTFAKNNHSQVPLHPVQQIHNSMISYEQLYSTDSDRFYRGSCEIGFNGIIDRNLIDYKKLINERNFLKKKERQIAHDFTLIDFFDSNSEFIIMTAQKIDFYITKDLRAVQFALYSATIPIFLCCLYISIFSVKVNTQTQEKKYVLMRSRGLSRKAIRNEFLYISFIVGSFSSLLSCFGGVGVFYLFNPFFSNLFILNNSNSLTLQFRFSQIVINLVISVISMGLASISSIIWINRKKTCHLLSDYGSDGLNLEFSEKTLFRSPTGRFKRKNLPYLEENTKKFDCEDNEISKLEATTPSTTPLAKPPTYSPKPAYKYLDMVRVESTKFKQIGIISMILGSFWFLILALIPLSYVSFMPDWFVLAIQGYIEKANTYLVISLLAFISPLFLTFGLVRFLIKESPKRFARISQKLAKIFVKDHDFLVALHTIKQKSHYSFILVFSLFCSLFLFTNISLYSFQSYYIANNNLQAGADINVDLSQINYFGNDSAVSLTFDEIQDRDNQIKTFLNQNDISCYDCSTCIKIAQDHGFNYEDEITHSIYLYYLFIDIDNYISTVTEDHKFSNNLNLLSSLKTIGSSSNHLIAINELYQEQYGTSIGDKLQLKFLVQNTTSQTINEYNISGEVSAIVPFFPGLQNPHEISVLLDLQLLPPIEGELYIPHESRDENDEIRYQHSRMSQLIDIDRKLLKNPKQILSILNKESFDWYNFFNFDSYAYSYSSIQIPLDMRSIIDNFYLYYYDLFIIGGVLSFALALSSIIIQRQNSHSHGVYLSKGIGSKALKKLIMAEQNVIFIISLGIGILSGVLPALVFSSLIKQYDFGISTISQLPTIGNFIEIIGILGGILLIANVVFKMAFFRKKGKSIITYFQ